MVLFFFFFFLFTSSGITHTLCFALTQSNRTEQDQGLKPGQFFLPFPPSCFIIEFVLSVIRFGKRVASVTHLFVAAEFLCTTRPLPPLSPTPAPLHTSHSAQSAPSPRLEPPSSPSPCRGTIRPVQARPTQRSKSRVAERLCSTFSAAKSL